MSGFRQATATRENIPVLAASPTGQDSLLTALRNREERRSDLTPPPSEASRHLRRQVWAAWGPGLYFEERMFGNIGRLRSGEANKGRIGGSFSALVCHPPIVNPSLITHIAGHGVQNVLQLTSAVPVHGSGQPCRGAPASPGGHLLSSSLRTTPTRHRAPRRVCLSLHPRDTPKSCSSPLFS